MCECERESHPHVMSLPVEAVDTARERERDTERERQRARKIERHRDRKT